jgi:hypothetical protein
MMVSEDGRDFLSKNFDSQEKLLFVVLLTGFSAIIAEGIKKPSRRHQEGAKRLFDLT